MKIEITEVQIYPVYGYNTIKAYAKIAINGCLIVKDIKVINSEENNLFISMPSKKHNDHYYDIVHPADQETRKYIEDIIISAYKKMMDAMKVQTIDKQN